MFQFGPKNVSVGKSLSVNFLAREIKTSTSELTIVVRLIYVRKKVEFNAGIRITPGTWCEKRQESKVSHILNKRLLFSFHCQSSKEIACGKGIAGNRIPQLTFKHSSNLNSNIKCGIISIFCA